MYHGTGEWDVPSTRLIDWQRSLHVCNSLQIHKETQDNFPAAKLAPCSSFLCDQVNNWFRNSNTAACLQSAEVHADQEDENLTSFGGTVQTKMDLTSFVWVQVRKYYVLSIPDRKLWGKYDGMYSTCLWQRGKVLLKGREIVKENIWMLSCFLKNSRESSSWRKTACFGLAKSKSHP